MLSSPVILPIHPGRVWWYFYPFIQKLPACDQPQRAFEWHAALDAFRHQLVGRLGAFLEIAIGRAVATGHGAQRAHAAVGFVGAALEQFHLARRFLGTGKHGADHNGMGAGHQGLGYIPGIANAAIIHISS